MFLVNWINILNQIIDCPKQYAGKWRYQYYDKTWNIDRKGKQFNAGCLNIVIIALPFIWTNCRTGISVRIVKAIDLFVKQYIFQNVLFN